jgi:hypothetical protein
LEELGARMEANQVVVPHLRVQAVAMEIRAFKFSTTLSAMPEAEARMADSATARAAAAVVGVVMSEPQPPVLLEADLTARLLEVLLARDEACYGRSPYPKDAADSLSHAEMVEEVAAVVPDRLVREVTVGMVALVAAV